MTARPFTNAMQKSFLNNFLDKPGSNKMKLYNTPSGTQEGTARQTVQDDTSGGNGSDSGFIYKPNNSSCKFSYASTGDQVCLDVSTVFDVVNYMKYTNCPMCKLPKNHLQNHYLQNYPHGKEIGLDVEYVPSDNKHQSPVHAKFSKKKNIKTDRPSPEEQTKPMVDNTMDKDDKTTKTSNKTEPPAGGKGLERGRSARLTNRYGLELGLGRFGVLQMEYPSESNTNDSSSNGSFVPADVVVNNVDNPKSNPYIALILSSYLSKFDYHGENNVRQQCLSVAKKANHNLSRDFVDNYDKVVPGSRVSAHMLKCQCYFCNY